MLKQYVVIPKSLKMSPGKLAAQVAHSTFLALEKEDKELIAKWKKRGMCVIILQCRNPVFLERIAGVLKLWKIKHYVYVDEGLNEIEAFSPTALATGILDEEESKVFSSVRLYR